LILGDDPEATDTENEEEEHEQLNKREEMEGPEDESQIRRR
jgi:hypothetical protein